MADIIVAGNTSGAITISAPLVAGSGVLTLPTGTDTLVGKATTDTLTNKTLGAGTVFPAGAVLQVVSATTTSSTSTSSTSFVSTSLTASITPKFNTSKIYVVVSGGEMDSGVIGTVFAATIYRGATNLAGTSWMSDSYGTSSRIQSTLSCSFLDSPATTSSTTYTIYIKSGGVAGTIVFNANPVQACITLLEIAV